MTTEKTKHSNLMTALNFTQEDLVANQQGQLSTTQADRLKSIRQRNTLIGAVIFFVIVIVATTFIFIGQQNQNTILSAMGGLLTVLNAVMMGGIGRSYMRTSADLREGGIEVLEGELERVVRQGRQQNNYLIRIAQADIYVPQDVFLHFKHENNYRIYRTRLSGVLLSAESLSR